MSDGSGEKSTDRMLLTAQAITIRDLRADLAQVRIEIAELEQQVEFWKKRAEIEGEATMNAVEAAELMRAVVEAARNLAFRPLKTHIELRKALQALDAAQAAEPQSSS